MKKTAAEKRKMRECEHKTKMNRPCPICSSEDKSFLYKQDFHNDSIAPMESYDVVMCKKCGFVFADRIPKQSEFSRYYAEMSKYEFNYKEGAVSDDSMTHFKKILSFINPHVKDKKKSVLDIGCSTGALLSIFKEEGFSDVAGLDPSPSCVKSARKLYGIDVKLNDLAGFKPERMKKYGLIILSDVLEHLVDFDDSLRKINSIIEEGGWLFIGVPDAERFSDYITAPFQQFSVEHINYFSRQSITNLLLRHGFKIVKIEHVEAKFDLKVDPDLFVMAKKIESDDRKSVKEIKKDSVSENSIKDYISKCSALDANIKRMIREKTAGMKSIIVWGVGTHTQRLIGSGLELTKVKFFVDSNARYAGKRLSGKEIKLPENIGEYIKDIPILISTQSFQEEIADQIRHKLRLKNEIIKIY